MQLKGKHVLQATPEEVWTLLMDAEALAKITPGVSRLEETGNNTYKAISEVKIGPVKGSFEGALTMENIVDQKSFDLVVTQKSKIGNVEATVQINLEPTSEAAHTELSFNGKAKLSGLLARTGQRVLTGVSNTLTKQFFAAFDEELAARNV